jgi:circadian clock protein KaiB
MAQIKLKLYVTGKTYRSKRAIETVREIYETLGKEAELSVIDILEDPELAEEDKILATPTLIKISPDSSSRRIIGDLSDLERVKKSLDLETTSYGRRIIDDY